MPGEQTFEVKVADKTVSTTLNVDFKISPQLVDSFIVETDSKNNSFTQVVYVNPKHQKLENTKLSIRADYWEKSSNSVATINKENTTFQVYKVPVGSDPDFPHSFGVDVTKYDEIDIKPKFGIADKDHVEYAEFDFSIFSDYDTTDGTGYIIIMNSKTDNLDDKENNLVVSAQVNTSNEESYYWNNENIIEPADTSIEGDNIYQLGDYVWHDLNEDGIQDSNEPGVKGIKVTLEKPDGATVVTWTDENGYYLFKNIPNGEYTVTIEIPEGYELTDKESGDDRRYDSNGEKTENGAKAKVTIQGANDYTIDFGIFNHRIGTFVEEHHYFIKYVDENGNPVDKNGNPVKEGQNIVEQTNLKEDPKTTTGKDGDEFTSELENKDGYKYNPDKTTTQNFGDNTTINKESGKVTGQYVANEEQKVVYNYYKMEIVKNEVPTENEGTFVEEHHYFIKYVDDNGSPVDKNGKPVESGENVVEQEDLKVGPKTTTGKAGGKFTSELENKDGYKYNSDETTTKNFGDNTTINKESGKVTGQYVANVEQKVVYNYYKTEIVKKPPVTPIDPTDPTEPGDNETPGKPDDGGNNTPEQPDDNETPEKPDDGGNNTPEKPDDNETPEKPPVVPIGPTDPTEPGDKETPGQPDNGGDNTPEKPDNNEMPDKPDTEEPDSNKPEPKPTPKPEPKPEPRPEPKPVPKPTPKPDLNTDKDPELKPMPKPDHKPESKPEQKPGSTSKDEPKQLTPKLPRSSSTGRTSESKKHLPKTGAGIYPGIYAGAMVVTGGALTLLGLKRRRDDDEEK